MVKQTLEEKIKLSEELVDKYLNEDAVGVVNAVSTAINTASGLGRDAAAVADWAKRKFAERKRAQMLAQQEKEKNRQSASRKQNTA